MHRKGFTLLELLIVIAILAVLATVAVLVINPMEYLRQSRDAKRIADMSALNKALNLAEFENVSLGSASTTVFVSLVDTVASCANLGLPQLPTGYQYNCVTTAANLKKTDGTGWIPVNLGSITGGAPLTVLPVDPVNNAAAFYSYIPGGSFALSATLESEKYLKQSALPDGGTNPGKIEIGSDIKLLTKAEGLAGYWPLDEGVGSTTNDLSGGGNSGTLVGASTWVTGKIGNALNFTGGRVNLGSITTPVTVTISAWIKTTTTAQNPIFSNRGSGVYYGIQGGKFFIYYNVGTPPNLYSNALINNNIWRHIVWVSNGTTSTLYIDGKVDSVQSQTRSSQAGTAYIAYDAPNLTAFAGSIDDVRIYNRTLSALEIQSMYDATK